MKKKYWSYLAGLIESDGAIQCFFDKNRDNLNYVVKITSKKNTNSLGDIQAFLKDEGIVSGVTDVGDEGRAPSLRIQGNEQVVRFLKKLKQNVITLENEDDNYLCPLLGVKFRNLCLILAAHEVNPSLTTEQKIDLKKTFHKENYQQQDILGTGLSRSEFEKRYGLEKNASVGALKELVEKVDAVYELHLNVLKRFCGKLNPDYVVGLYDGDGGFNVSFSQNKKDEILDIQCDINLTLPTSDQHILDVVRTHFELSRITIQKNVNSREMKIRTQQGLKTVIAFFDKYPLQGDYKATSLALVKETLDKKRQGFFRKGSADLNEFKAFVQKVYDHSNLGRTNIKTIFQFIDNFYKFN